MFLEDTLQLMLSRQNGVMLTLLSAAAGIYTYSRVKSVFNLRAEDSVDDETDFRKKKRRTLRDRVHPYLDDWTFENLGRTGPTKKKREDKSDLDEDFQRLLDDYESLKNKSHYLSSYMDSWRDELADDYEEPNFLKKRHGLRDFVYDYEEPDFFKKERHGLRDSVYPDLDEITYCTSCPTGKELEDLKLKKLKNIKRLREQRDILRKKNDRIMACVDSYLDGRDALSSPNAKEKTSIFDVQKEIQSILGSKASDTSNAAADCFEKDMKDFRACSQDKTVNEKDKSWDAIKKKHGLRDDAHSDSEDWTYENLGRKTGSIKQKREVKFDLDENFQRLLDNYENLKLRRKDPSSNIHRWENENSLLLPSKCPKEKKSEGKEKKSVEKKSQDIASKSLDMMKAIADDIDKTIKIFQDKKTVNEKVKSRDTKKMDGYTSASDDSVKDYALPKPSQNLEKWLKIIRSDNDLKKALERFFMLYSVGNTTLVPMCEKDIFHKAFVQYLQEFSSDMSSKNADDFFKDGGIISSKDTIESTEGSSSEDDIDDIFGDVVYG